MRCDVRKLLPSICDLETIHPEDKSEFKLREQVFFAACVVVAVTCPRAYLSLSNPLDPIRGLCEYPRYISTAIHPHLGAQRRM